MLPYRRLDMAGEGWGDIEGWGGIDGGSVLIGDGGSES